MAAMEVMIMNQKEKVFSNSFILVVIGQIISLFGNSILRFALPLHLLTVTGSPALYGIVTALAFIPIILCTPIGGVIADRVNKRNIMVCLDFSVAGIMLVFSLLYGKVNVVILLTVVLMLLYGIAGAYQPSVQASIPFLVKEDGIISANAIINIISSLSSLIGPVIGGICYSFAGLTPILILSILCFFTSAIMELFIKMDCVKRPFDGNVLSVIFHDMKDTVIYIKNKQPIIFRALIMCALANFLFSSFLTVALPTLITQTLAFPTNEASRLLGYTEAAMAFGGLVGGLLGGKFCKNFKITNIYQFLFAFAVFLLPIGGVLLLHAPSYVCYFTIAICCFFMMMFSNIFLIICMSYIQIYIPSDKVAKTISLAMMISQCAQPLGNSFYGLLLQYFINHIGFITILVACATAALGILFSNGLKKDFKSQQLEMESSIL